MKYRLLNEDELVELEEEFKHFLIVNGVHAEEWEKMNQMEPYKAVKLVEMFSDSVLQKVYEKIKYIEHRLPEACMVFKCGTNAFELISINVKPGEKVALETPEGIHDALVHHPDSLTYFRTKKAYNKTREEEIHNMFNQGCVHSSSEFWALLDKAIS